MLVAMQPGNHASVYFIFGTFAHIYIYIYIYKYKYIYIFKSFYAIIDTAFCTPYDSGSLSPMMLKF